MFLLTLLSPKEVGSQNLRRLRITYSSFSPEQAMAYVTKEAGFFEKNGLDVELIQVRGAQAAAALAAREVYIAQMAGPGAVQVALAGADAVMVAGIVNHPDFSLVVPKAIRTSEDLRGKKVAVSRFGGSSDFVTRLALRHLGLEAEKDVAIIQVGGSAERLVAMKAGTIHAAVLTTGEKLNALRQGFHELLDLSRTDYPYQHTGVASTRSFIRSDEGTVRSFIRAYVEGIHVYKTRRDFTISSLSKFLRLSDMGLLSDIYDVYYQRLPRAPYPTVEGIRNILTELSSRLPKAKTAKATDFIEARFVKELDESGFIGRLYR
jgi:NitT/TauT family transport system substrate-binding protein